MAHCAINQTSNYQDPASDARGYYSTTGNYQTTIVSENNSIKGSSAEGISAERNIVNKQNLVEMYSYVQKTPEKTIASLYKTLVANQNMKEYTFNQNKEQKILWFENTFIDGPGEDSAYTQIGLLNASTELNNTYAKTKGKLYFQLQFDCLNSSINAGATNSGFELGMSSNVLALSGKIGYQDDKRVISVGGSLGYCQGWELSFKRDAGLVIDTPFTCPPRIEIYWNREAAGK